MGVPELHVGAVGSVADVQGIEHQQPAEVTRPQRGDQPGVAVAAHGVQVGTFDPGGGPFVEGKLGRPDLGPVVVGGRAVRFGGEPARGVDLAVFDGIGCVVGHGGAPCVNGRLEPIWVSMLAKNGQFDVAELSFAMFSAKGDPGGPKAGLRFRID